MMLWLRGAHPLIWTSVITVAFISGLFLFKEKPLYEAHAAVETAKAGDELLSSGALILKAARKAGLNTDRQFNEPAGNSGLIANVKAHLALRSDGQLIHVTFTAFDANRAAGFANAWIEAYSDELESRGLANAVELSDGLEQLQAAIDQKEAMLANIRLTQAQTRDLIRDVNHQRDLHDAMLMRASAARSAGRFASPAVVPIEPINYNPWSGLVYAVPLLLSGAVLVLVSRSRLRSLPEPAAHLDIMCSQAEIAQPVVAVANAGTGFVSPDTLLNYVENLLSAGHRVLIVDCELGGALTDSVGLRGEHGFSDFLMDSPMLAGAIPAWSTNHEGVSVMPVGTRPNRVPSLMQGARLRIALAMLLAKFDRVVINAPPVLTTGEMRELSPLVDGVILVTAQDRSLALPHLAIRQVEEFGGRVIGLVEDPYQLAPL